MSCPAPPERRAARLVNSDGPRKAKKHVRRRRYRNPAPLATYNYLALLEDRYAEGLLVPFTCSCCGCPALDPIGWTGRRQPLCKRCADPEEPLSESAPSVHGQQILLPNLERPTGHDIEVLSTLWPLLSSAVDVLDGCHNCPAAPLGVVLHCDHLQGKGLLFRG